MLLNSKKYYRVSTTLDNVNNRIQSRTTGVHLISELGQPLRSFFRLYCQFAITKAAEECAVIELTLTLDIVKTRIQRYGVNINIGYCQKIGYCRG